MLHLWTAIRTEVPSLLTRKTQVKSVAAVRSFTSVQQEQQLERQTAMILKQIKHQGVVSETLGDSWARQCCIPRGMSINCRNNDDDQESFSGARLKHPFSSLCRKL